MTDPNKTLGLFTTPLNKKLIADLEAQESLTICKLSPPLAAAADLNEAARELLLRPAGFDWIIFTDVFAVDFYLSILEAENIDFFELDEVRICAFGEAVSDRLRFVQLHTDVLPNKLDAAGIAAAVRNYIGDAADLKNLKVLIVGGEDAANTAPVGEFAKMMDVTAAAVYRLTPESEENTPKTKALLKGGAIDEFIFSAPEDVIYLKFFLAGEALDGEFFERILATDLATFKALSENSLKAKMFVR